MAEQEQRDLDAYLGTRFCWWSAFALGAAFFGLLGWAVAS